MEAHRADASQLPPREHAHGPEREIGLADVIRFLWEQKWIIGGTTFLGAAVAVVLALTATPVYRVETVLAPVSEDSSLASLASQVGGLASLAGISIGGGSGQDEALAILRSRALTSRFIEENQLLPVLYSDKWDAERQQWRVSEEGQMPTLWDAVTRFRQSVQSISQDALSGLVTLRIQWTDPKVAAEWAAAITGMTNEIIQQRAISEAEKSIEFLKEELSKTSIVEVQQAISRVIEEQTKVLALANVREEYAFRVVDPPAVPDLDYPVSPRKRLMVAVGCMLGGMIGLFVAFLRVLLRRP